MKINIQSVHCSVSENTQELIMEKLEKLTAYYNRIESATVIFKGNKDNRKQNFLSEIRLAVPGPDLFASGKDGSADEAFDRAFSGIRNQLRKFKGKISEIR